jgi:hypothetical protein
VQRSPLQPILRRRGAWRANGENCGYSLRHARSRRAKCKGGGPEALFVILDAALAYACFMNNFDIWGGGGGGEQRAAVQQSQLITVGG